MALSTLATCDLPQMDGGRPVGTCARNAVVSGDLDEARKQLMSLGWLLGGEGQMRCPIHNPIRQHPRSGDGPWLRDAGPRPRADRPSPPNGGQVTPLRPKRPRGTV